MYDIDKVVAGQRVKGRVVLGGLPVIKNRTVTGHNVIPRLSATPGALRRPAPSLGEHTSEVLSRVGVTAADLAALKAEGIV
jgi:crotonobetainyl-CoA:carnitine CoA-transferase CaiB-like acyl-CoA transferase